MLTPEEIRKLREKGLAPVDPLTGLPQADSLISPAIPPQGMSEPITTPSVIGPTPGQEQLSTPPALSVTTPDSKISVLPTIGISPPTSSISVLGETPGPITSLPQPIASTNSELANNEEAAKVEKPDLSDSDELSAPSVAYIVDDDPDSPIDSRMDPTIILNQKPPDGSLFSTPFPSENPKQPEISTQSVLPKIEPLPTESSPPSNPIQEIVPTPKVVAPLAATVPVAPEIPTIPDQSATTPIDILKSEAVAQPVVVEAQAAPPTPEKPATESLPPESLVRPEGEHLLPTIHPAVESHVRLAGEPPADMLHQKLADAHPDHAEVTGPQLSAEGIDGINVKINTGAWGPNALKATVPGIKPDMSNILSIHSDRLAKKEAHVAGVKPKIFEKFLSFFKRKKKVNSTTLAPTTKAA